MSRNTIMKIDKTKVLSLLLSLLIIIANSNTIHQNVDHKYESEGLLRPLMSISDSDLKIEVIEPENQSTISNESEILLKLTGSNDKKIFYRWSNDLDNTSFTILDQYFIIEEPNITDSEGWLNLFLFSAINSTLTNTTWFYLRLTYFYDNKVPSYQLSTANNSEIVSYNFLNFNFSEGIFNGSYRWNNEITVGIPDNSKNINLTIVRPTGNHNLYLTLYDSVGNFNNSYLRFNILFNIISTPKNNSVIKGGSNIILSSSEPFNGFYSWNNDPFSGVLDPIPDVEGCHNLSINFEKEPGEYELWNFSYTVDNTPISMVVSPGSGYISPRTNISVQALENPQDIWYEIKGDGVPSSGRVDMNGSNPYWFILPESYGKVNITIKSQDIAGNMGEDVFLYDISFGILSITPENNSLIDQGVDIDFNFNTEEWRTIVFNIDNQFNTSYLPQIPLSSGLHNLTVFLEDIEKRWTSELYQWSVKPRLDLTNSFNGSSVRTEFYLNISFGETIGYIEYFWENTTIFTETNMESINTSLDDWSNKTEDVGTLSINARGTDDIWNNQTFKFIRDDLPIDINLYHHDNNSVINTPFFIEVILSEIPTVVIYNWDYFDNETLTNLQDERLAFLLPLNVTANPHILEIFVSDNAWNWNYSKYSFYTGTGIQEIDYSNGSLIRGGSKLEFNLTIDPLEIGYKWINQTTNSTISDLVWITSSSLNVTIPIINDWAELVMFYNLSNEIMINETIIYQIDSTPPAMLLMGIADPFKDKEIAKNNTVIFLNSDTNIEISVTKNATDLLCRWNNETTLYNSSMLLDDSIFINLNELEWTNRTGFLTVLIVDSVDHFTYYHFSFIADDEKPSIVKESVDENGRIRPNSTIDIEFNKSISLIHLEWSLDDLSVKNMTIDSYISNKISILSLATDGWYKVVLQVFDISGNHEIITRHYIVDGTPPTVSPSITNNSIVNHEYTLTIQISEQILNESYYIWLSSKIAINITSLSIPLNLSEGNYSIKFFLTDLVGNNASYLYNYVIDNSPISRPISDMTSGSFYSSDQEINKLYFSEYPSLVIGNWDDTENFSASVYTQPSMHLMIDQNDNSFWIMVYLPSGTWETHTLRLYIKDNAGNWCIYEFDYFKIPNFTEVFPLIVISISSILIILYMKRDTMYERLGIRVNTIEVKEEIKGDKITYKKGDDRFKKKKKKKKR